MGRLPAEAVKIPLTGDIAYTTGINVNGIEQTPDGKGLLLVQSNTGKLFRADPKTGVTKQVDLGTELLTNGDGLLLEGAPADRRAELPEHPDVGGARPARHEGHDRAQADRREVRRPDDRGRLP